jgi:hypothetical protein
MFQVLLVDALPGGHAALDGGPGCFGAGLRRLGWDWSGFDYGEFCGGGCRHSGSSV